MSWKPRNLLVVLVAVSFSLVGAVSYSISAQDKAEEAGKADKADKLDESKEPSLTYILKLGDKSIELTEGVPARIEGNYNNPEITLTPQSFRVFSYRGVSFKYPRVYMFEADVEDAGHKNWTLSGNDFKIMYFVVNARMTTGEFADSMIKQFGRRNCTVANAAPMKFGDNNLSGTTLHATVAGHKMAIDIYLVSSTGTQTKLLVLQDSLGDDGGRSIEGKASMGLMRESFKLER